MYQEVTVTLLSKEEAVSSQYSKEKLGENYFTYSPFIYFSVFIYLYYIGSVILSLYFCLFFSVLYFRLYFLSVLYLSL